MLCWQALRGTGASLVKAPAGGMQGSIRQPYRQAVHACVANHKNTTQEGEPGCHWTLQRRLFVDFASLRLKCPSITSDLRGRTTSRTYTFIMFS